MRSSRMLVVSIALAIAAAGELRAQTCEGRPGFDDGRTMLTAGHAAATGTSLVEVGVDRLGMRAYGGVTLGSISYDEFTGSTTALGAGAGYQIPLGVSGRAQLCPTISVEIGFGPNNIEGTGLDASTRGFGTGVVIGFRAITSADLSVIPSFGIGLASSSVKFTDGLNSVTESETYGQVSIGVGFVIGLVFSAQPFVVVPFGVEDADPVIGLAVSLSLSGAR